MERIYSNRNYRGFYESFGYIDVKSTPSDFPVFVGFSSGPVKHKDVEHYFYIKWYDQVRLFINEDIRSREIVYRGIKRGKIKFWDCHVVKAQARNLAELFFEVFAYADPSELTQLSELYYQSDKSGQETILFTSTGTYMYASHNRSTINYVCNDLPKGRWEIDLITAMYVLNNREPYKSGKGKVDDEIKLPQCEDDDISSVHVVDPVKPIVSDKPKTSEKNGNTNKSVNPQPVIEDVGKTKSKNNSNKKKNNTQTTEVIERVRIRRTFTSRE